MRVLTPSLCGIRHQFAQEIAADIESSRQAALRGLRASPLYGLVQSALESMDYPSCPTHDNPGGGAPVAPVEAAAAAQQGAAADDARAEASEDRAAPSRALAWTALLLAAPPALWSGCACIFWDVIMRPACCLRTRRCARGGLPRQPVCVHAGRRRSCESSSRRPCQRLLRRRCRT